MAQTRKSNASIMPLRVGVVVSGEMTRESLFVNEQHQSALFQVMAFLAIPEISEVNLVYTSHRPKLPEELGLSDLRLVEAAAACGICDLVIAEGGQIERPLLASIKASGAKVACYKRRSPALQSIEWTVASNEASRAERYFDHDLYDEVWMIDELVPTCQKWAETIYRCKVRTVPRLWSACLIPLSHPATYSSFGFKDTPKKWRVGVAQSNNSVADTFHVPALICNAAYTKSPSWFDAVYVANTSHLAGSHHAVSFMDGLPIVKKRKMTAEPWFLPLDLMSQHCDALVSHVWGDAVPNWYFEALHGNYPLIHNSEQLRSVGYYYPEFDVKAGADALLSALRHHRSSAAAEANRNFLHRIDPANEEVQAGIFALVAALKNSN